jgi:hypothetical protein
MFARPSFSCTNSADLAQAVAIAARKPGFLAPILEGVAEPGIAVGLAAIRFDPCPLPQLACIQYRAQGRQNRQLYLLFLSKARSLQGDKWRAACHGWAWTWRPSRHY